MFYLWLLWCCSGRWIIIAETWSPKMLITWLFTKIVRCLLIHTLQTALLVLSSHLKRKLRSSLHLLSPYSRGGLWWKAAAGKGAPSLPGGFCWEGEHSQIHVLFTIYIPWWCYLWRQISEIKCDQGGKEETMLQLFGRFGSREKRAWAGSLQPGWSGHHRGQNKEGTVTSPAITSTPSLCSMKKHIRDQLPSHSEETFSPLVLLRSLELSFPSVIGWITHLSPIHTLKL